MASQRAQFSVSTDAIQRDEARVPAHQSLVLVAERELLAALSEQAHRLDLRAEELAIAIKQVWSQLASVRSSRLGERDSDVLRGVVSSSIEVFFESRDADRRGAQLPEQQTE